MRIVMGWIFAAAAFCQGAFAAGPPVGHIFQKGQAAVAAEVNDNFQQLADRIQAVTPVVYDYRLYLAGSSTTKTFSRVDSAMTSRITETTPRYDSQAGTWTTQWTQDAGAVTQYDYKSTPAAGLQMVAQRTYTTGNTTTPSETQTFLTPVTLTPAFTPVNGVWAFASEIKLENGAATSVTIGWQGISVLAGVESVQVPARSYDNCLKIVTTMNSRNTTAATGGLVLETNWYCPGVGLVKRLTTESSYTNKIELTAIQQ